MFFLYVYIVKQKSADFTGNFRRSVPVGGVGVGVGVGVCFWFHYSTITNSKLIILLDQIIIIIIDDPWQNREIRNKI